MENEKREKTGGRQKGTPNRTTAEIRAKFQILIDNTVDEVLELSEWNTELTLKDKIDFIAKLLPYVMPKAVSEKEAHVFEPVEINIIYPKE